MARPSRTRLKRSIFWLKFFLKILHFLCLTNHSLSRHGFHALCLKSTYEQGKWKGACKARYQKVFWTRWYSRLSFKNVFFLTGQTASQFIPFPFPSCWKIAFVQPVAKERDTSYSGNYRPIANCSNLAKKNHSSGDLIGLLNWNME